MFSGLRPWQQDLIKKAYAEPSFRKTRQKINQLVEEETWANELKGKEERGRSLIVAFLFEHNLYTCLF